MVSIAAAAGHRAAPPFTYGYREGGQARTGGLAWRVLAELLPPERWTLRIAVLPWSRCLRSIEEGTQDLTVNATWNTERARQYLLTRPYFLSHVHAFWSREQFATPPAQSIEDLEGEQAMGATYLADPRIEHAPLPGVDRVRRCFLFRRDTPRLAEVAATIDAGLERIEATGELERLVREENELLRARFAAPR